MQDKHTLQARCFAKNEVFTFKGTLKMKLKKILLIVTAAGLLMQVSIALALQCYAPIGIGFTQGTEGTGDNFNFEIVTPHTSGGFSAYYRNNDKNDEFVNNYTWYGPKAAGWGNVQGIALLENEVYNPSGPIAPVPGYGNLEAMATIDGQLYHFWRDRNDDNRPWSSGTWVTWGVRGQPGFIQSNQNRRNFEVVVALENGGLAHWWRSHDDANDMSWHQSIQFAQGITFDSVSLIQSNFGLNPSSLTGGNLEVIARSTAGRLYHMYREGDTEWSNPREIVLADGSTISATGVHSFVQGKSGTKGNFELIVPLSGGGLAHFYRDNDTTIDGFYPWYKAAGMVDGNISRRYTSAAVIASSFGDGNLEVVARRENDGALVSFHAEKGTSTWNHKSDQGNSPVWAGAVVGGEPCCYAPDKGKWQTPFNAKAIGIHAALQPTGKVLLFGFDDNADMGFSELFNPLNGEGEIPSLLGDSHLPHAFCSGHALMENGEMWVAGGHGADHLADSYVFRSWDNEWEQLDDLGDEPLQWITKAVGSGYPYREDGRWYPTLTRLEDGSVMAISGSKTLGRLETVNEVNSTFQIMEVIEGVENEYELSENMPVPNPFAEGYSHRSIMMYPFAYQLPQGGVLVHSEKISRIMYPTNPEESQWDGNFFKETNYEYARTYPGSGSSVMLPLSSDTNYAPRIMLIGGGGDVSIEFKCPTGAEIGCNNKNDSLVPATATVEMLDFRGNNNPDWEYVASMHHARVLNNAVLLPDGTVFVVGGSATGATDIGPAPVMTPEIYNPETNTWTEMCPMRMARLYHSTALLLPDGRVMTAGTDHEWNPKPYDWPERRVEIFSPPYLEKGLPRPVINSISRGPHYFGNRFQVQLNASAVNGYNISKAMLIAPGAVTHSFDQTQRAIQLDIEENNWGDVILKMPPNGRVAPPGMYMLFLVSNNGVPSVAEFVRIYD